MNQSVANPLGPLATPIVPNASNTYSFQLDCVGAVLQAYALNGFTIETPTGEDLQIATTALNLVLSNWTSRGNNTFNFTENQIAIPVGATQIVLPTGTVDVWSATLRQTINGEIIDAPLFTRINREAYAALPNKFETGTPVMYFLDRQYTPIVNLYQPPDVGTYSFEYYAVMQNQDAGTPSQSPAVPYRWQMALVRGLAVEVALIKKNYEGLTVLKGLYDEAYNQAAASDRDKANSRLIFDMSSYTRR